MLSEANKKTKSTFRVDCRNW